MAYTMFLLTYQLRLQVDILRSSWKNTYYNNENLREEILNWQSVSPMTVVLLYASFQRQDHVFFITCRRWRRELIVEGRGDGKTEMQENILLLKGVKMLGLADQRAEGMDWCQAAATRGFPDFCVMLRKKTGKNSPFSSSAWILSVPYKKQSLCYNVGKQTPAKRRLPIFTLHLLCCLCCQTPEAQGRDTTFIKTAHFLKPSLLRSCEQYGKPASVTPPPQGISSYTCE